MVKRGYVLHRINCTQDIYCSKGMSIPAFPSKDSCGIPLSSQGCSSLGAPCPREEELDFVGTVQMRAYLSLNFKLVITHGTSLNSGHVVEKVS